jgi:threonylcarbamoyladenosine tRNA methylthiotransferase MtaB
LYERGKVATIALKSVGCRTNQEEMNELAFKLAECGFGVVEDDCKADILIVNTCSVTLQTEAKTLRMLRHLARINPGADICVTGCLAQQNAERMISLPNVKWVVGNYLKNSIHAIIADGRTGIFMEPLENERSLSIENTGIVFNPERRTRFPLKIQEGCDFRCSYCIVPFLRGPSRCVSSGEVVDSCSRAVAAGFKEIVLTGTHIGQYQNGGIKNLDSLVERILAIPGNYRIRLGSLDPADITARLVSLVTSHPKICRHFHVSFQSLSVDVVSRMNRSPKDMEEAVERLHTARSVDPFVGIGADFIVGFPGETDLEFSETIDGIKKIGFSYSHIFRYSKRSGTAAVNFQGQIDENEKRIRSLKLRSIVGGCRKNFIRNCIGVYECIVSETENPVTGLTSNYLRVELENSSVKRNSWCNVKIVDMTAKTGKIMAKQTEK